MVDGQTPSYSPPPTRAGPTTVHTGSIHCRLYVLLIGGQDINHLHVMGHKKEVDRCVSETRTRISSSNRFKLALLVD